jgi:hypothetical protein
LQQLVNDGATILINDKPLKANGMTDDRQVKQAGEALWASAKGKASSGKVLTGPYQEVTFDKIGITRDVIVKDSAGNYANGIAWTHRGALGFDIYFISNQQEQQRTIELSFRSTKGRPELWDALTGEIVLATDWQVKYSRTVLPLQLAANGSVFVVLKKDAASLQPFGM